MVDTNDSVSDTPKGIGDETGCGSQDQPKGMQFEPTPYISDPDYWRYRGESTHR